MEENKKPRPGFFEKPKEFTERVFDLVQKLIKENFLTDDEKEKAFEIAVRMSETSSKDEAKKIIAENPELWSEYLVALRKLYKLRHDSNLESNEELSTEQLRIVRDEFLPVDRWMRSIVSLKSYIDTCKRLVRNDGESKNSRRKGLWGYQVEVLEEVLNALKDGVKLGHITMPTGTGKTVIFSQLIRGLAYRDEFYSKKRKALNDDTSKKEVNLENHPVESLDKKRFRALIVVPKKILGYQSQGIDMDENLIGKGLQEFSPEFNISRYFDGTKDLSGDVVVTTYQSLGSLLEDPECPNFDLVVADEAHKGLGPKTQESLKKINESSLLIGFTATPELREKNVDSYFGRCIYELELHEAIAQDYLAKLELPVIDDFDGEYEIIFEGSELSDLTMSNLRSDVNRNRMGVELAKRFIEMGRPGVISCVPGNNLAHAKLMADLLNQETIIDPVTKEERKMRAVWIGGENQQELDSVTKKLSEGQLDFVCFVDLLTEGWDCKEAKSLINLRPTNSRAVALQRLGRILRKNNSGNGEKNIAIAVDIVDKAVGNMGTEEKPAIYIRDVLRDNIDEETNLVVEKKEVFGINLKDEDEDESGEKTSGRSSNVKILKSKVKELPASFRFTKTPGGIRSFSSVEGYYFHNDEIYLSQENLAKIIDSKSIKKFLKENSEILLKEVSAIPLVRLLQYLLIENVDNKIKRAKGLFDSFSISPLGFTDEAFERKIANARGENEQSEPIILSGKEKNNLKDNLVFYVDLNNMIFNYGLFESYDELASNIVEYIDKSKNKLKIFALIIEDYKSKGILSEKLISYLEDLYQRILQIQTQFKQDLNFSEQMRVFSEKMKEFLDSSSKYDAVEKFFSKLIYELKNVTKSFEFDRKSREGADVLNFLKYIEAGNINVKIRFSQNLETVVRRILDETIGQVDRRITSDILEKLRKGKDIEKIKSSYLPDKEFAKSLTIDELRIVIQTIRDKKITYSAATRILSLVKKVDVDSNLGVDVVKNDILELIGNDEVGKEALDTELQRIYDLMEAA